MRVDRGPRSAVVALSVALSLSCGGRRLRVVDAPLAPESAGYCAGPAEHPDCAPDAAAVPWIGIWRPVDVASATEWATDSFFVDGCALYVRMEAPVGHSAIGPACAEVPGEQHIVRYPISVDARGALVVHACAPLVLAAPRGGDTVGALFPGWYSVYRRIAEEEISPAEVDLRDRCRAGTVTRSGSVP
jgi:hypothetical protein